MKAAYLSNLVNLFGHGQARNLRITRFVSHARAIYSSFSSKSSRTSMHAKRSQMRININPRFISEDLIARIGSKPITITFIAFIVRVFATINYVAKHHSIASVIWCASIRYTCLFSTDSTDIGPMDVRSQRTRPFFHISCFRAFPLN